MCGDQLVFGRIDAAQHFIEVLTNAFVAFAGNLADRVNVANLEPAAADGEDAALLEPSQHPADVAAADREHYLQGFRRAGLEALRTSGRAAAGTFESADECD